MVAETACQGIGLGKEKRRWSTGNNDGMTGDTGRKWAKGHTNTRRFSALLVASRMSHSPQGVAVNKVSNIVSEAITMCFYK